MLMDFFDTLRRGQVPCTVREYLDLLACMDGRLCAMDMDEFYALSRAVMVKDERHYDKFDRAFDHYFRGLEELGEVLAMEIPDEWLKARMRKDLSEEELRQLQESGGLEKLVEEFKKRWAEQRERHQGGNRRIGTGGTSPFGNNGDNNEGVKAGGQDGEGKEKGAKAWQQRNFRNLDDQVELGTRNIKMALRRLRRFAREGEADELDLPGTVRSTANNGGIIDIRMVPRAAQRRQGAGVLRCGRLHGAPCQGVRRAVLGLPHRVQEPGVLLFPQLRLRDGVEGQPPPLAAADPHPGHHAPLSRGLQGDLRRRRRHGPPTRSPTPAVPSSTGTRRLAWSGCSGSWIPTRASPG